ncbi:hypothetical protein LCGC14_3067690 [marine sediment metagenome]|uniref:Uncharacterized protein n=1 Tax=marine sediment metagenome TaxID=412755 RepID=A0A0F8Z7N2_9ZZZZ
MCNKAQTKKLNRWQWFGIALIVIGFIVLFLAFEASYIHYEEVVKWKLGPKYHPLAHGDSVPGRQLAQLEKMLRESGEPELGEFPAREALFYHRCYLFGALFVVLGTAILHKESIAHRVYSGENDKPKPIEL